MKIIKYPAPPAESAASRYDRDWLHIPDTDTAGNNDDRHSRTLLQQSIERKGRRYVTNGSSAVIGDNIPEEPEVPQEPTEPEVPVGSYQENYTENY